MKKEETINTTGTVYLTYSIYKTKAILKAHLSYITHPLLTTLTKKETLPNRLKTAFKSIIHYTHHPFPLLTQKHNTVITHKRQNGWGTNKIFYSFLIDLLGSPSIPPTKGI